MIPLLFIIYYFSKSFVIFYFILNYVLSLVIYFKASKNYFPNMSFSESELKKYKQDHPTEDPKKKKQYFHEDYPSFNRIEGSSLQFGWIFFGMLNYFWIKATGSILSLTCFWIHIKIYFRKKSIKAEFSKEDRVNLKRIGGLWVKLWYIFMGVWVTENNLESDPDVVKLYRKYLGEDYNPSEHKDKFTTVIANHVSWADILYLLSKFGSSFIAKDSAQRVPLVGYLSYAFKTLYIERMNKDSRIEILKEIEKRQNQILAGKSFFPLCIYPEGTTSNGRSLITFKRGAFYSLTPVKPFLLKVDNRNGSFPLAAGGMDIILNMVLATTHFKCDFGAIELPVFAPNDYLFENFKHLGKDKPEIFSEACRHIMSEIGGLPLSNASFETKLKYMSESQRKTVKNT